MNEKTSDLEKIFEKCREISFFLGNHKVGPLRTSYLYENGSLLVKNTLTCDNFRREENLRVLYNGTEVFEFTGTFKSMPSKNKFKPLSKKGDSYVPGDWEGELNEAYETAEARRAEIRSFIKVNKVPDYGFLNNLIKLEH